MSKALLKHKWLESCKQEKKQAAAPATAEDLPVQLAPPSNPAADAAPPAKSTAAEEALVPVPAAAVEPPVVAPTAIPTEGAPAAEPPHIKITACDQPAAAIDATAQQSSPPPPPQLQALHQQQQADPPQQAPPQLTQQQPEQQTHPQAPGPPQGQPPTQQSPQQLQLQQSLDSQQDQPQQQQLPPQPQATLPQQQQVSQPPTTLLQQPDTKPAKAGASAAGGPTAAHQGTATSAGLPHPSTAAHRGPGHHHTPHGALNRTKSGQQAGMLGLCLDNAITLSARPVSRPTALTPQIPKGRAKQEQRKQQQPKQELHEPATDTAADKPSVATKAPQPLDKKSSARSVAAPSGSGNQSHTSYDAVGLQGTKDDAGSRPQSKVQVEAGKESSAPGTASTKAAADKKATQATDMKADAAAVAAGKKQQQSQQQKGGTAAALLGKTAAAGSAAAGVKRKAADAGAKGGEEEQQPTKKKAPGLFAVSHRAAGTGTDESHEGVKRSKGPANKQTAAAAVAATKESSKASGSDQQGQSRGVKRQEVGSDGSPACKPPANSKATRAAGEQPHKQSRLAKQSSTNAVSAAKALAAAAADLSDEDDDDRDGDDDRQVAAAEKLGKRSVPVNKEKQEPSDNNPETSKPSAPATAVVARKSKIQGRIMLAGRFTDAKQQAAATAAAGAGHVKQEQQLQQHQAEVFIEPPEGGQWQPAEIELSKIHGWPELWRRVSGRYAQLLPRTEAPRWKVVYLDSDGDWVVGNTLQWQAFCDAATKVLVTSN